MGWRASVGACRRDAVKALQAPAGFVGARWLLPLAVDSPAGGRAAAGRTTAPALQPALRRLLLLSCALTTRRRHCGTACALPPALRRCPWCLSFCCARCERRSGARRCRLAAAAASRAAAAAMSVVAGLRSTTTGVRATVFGAGGFVGRYVVGLLAGGGSQVIAPFRGCELAVRHLKPMGDLGAVTLPPFSPRDVDSIRRAVDGSDVVINLVGKDYETKHWAPTLVNFSFADVNVRFAETVARCAVEAGVTNLVHVSALAADAFSLSEWARTKAAGEAAVRAVAPGATIVRPADVFGAEDRFLCLIARMYGAFPRVPVVDGGLARVQPIYVDDVAKAIYKIALSVDPDVMLGQTYDLAGPEEYTYREIIEYVFETIRATRPEVINLTPTLADALGSAINLLPNPLVTKDLFRRMQSDVVLDDMAPTKRLSDLGIEPTSMEAPGFTWLQRFRTGSHFYDLEGVEKR